jgi:F0F1-type ATP synthase membrane subunit a
MVDIFILTAALYKLIGYVKATGGEKERHKAFVKVIESIYSYFNTIHLDYINEFKNAHNNVILTLWLFTFLWGNLHLDLKC